MKTKAFLLTCVLCCVGLCCTAWTPQTANDLVKLFNDTQEECLGETIELSGDLDFTGVNLPLGWISETRAVTFCGTFNGNGHSIKNLVMNGEEFSGLFYNMQNAIVQNIVIDESCNFSAQIVGALTLMAGGQTTIANVTSRATVQGEFIAGLIASVTEGEVLIDRCALGGEVKKVVLGTEGNEFYGGLVASVYGFAGSLTMLRCVNNANITAEFSTVSASIGGLIGGVKECNMTITVVDCTNNGILNGTADYGQISAGGCIGSIVEDKEGSVTITRFVNNGVVSTIVKGLDEPSATGGIIGAVSGECENMKLVISKSTNNGIIEARANQAATLSTGGIVGDIQLISINVTLDNCINNGKIANTLNGGIFITGGLAGSIISTSDTHVWIYGCENNGDIGIEGTAVSSIGGLVGSASPMDADTVHTLEIENSVNRGNIHGLQQSTCCGIFCAMLEYGEVISRVKNSVNKGRVSGEYAYGIGNSGTYANNVVSMGILNGFTQECYLYGSIEEVKNAYGRNETCNRCTDTVNVTLFEKNGWKYETLEGKERVEDKLNVDAEREGYGKKWTSTLDMSEECFKVTMNGGVEGVWTSGRDTTFGDIGALWEVMNDGKHRVSEVGTMIVMRPKTLVTRDMNVTVTDKDRVLIELRGDKTFVDLGEVEKKIQELMGTEEKMEVTEKRDETGKIVGLYVLVDEGDKLVSALNGLDKGTGCVMGVLCECVQSCMVTGGDETCGASLGIVHIASPIVLLFSFFLSLFF